MVLNSVRHPKLRPNTQEYLARKAAEGKTQLEVRSTHNWHLTNKVIDECGETNEHENPPQLLPRLPVVGTRLAGFNSKPSAAAPRVGKTQS